MSPEAHPDEGSIREDGVIEKRPYVDSGDMRFTNPSVKVPLSNRGLQLVLAATAIGSALAGWTYAP